MDNSKYISFLASNSSNFHSLFWLLFFGEGNTYPLFNTVLLDYTLNTIYLIFLTSFFALLFGVFPAWIVSNNTFKGRSF